MRAGARGNRRARVFGAGFFVFALTGLHDLLASLGVIPLGHWLSSWGMLVLILLLSYILEQTYSDNLRQLRSGSAHIEQKGTTGSPKRIIDVDAPGSGSPDDDPAALDVNRIAKPDRRGGGDRLRQRRVPGQR